MSADLPWVFDAEAPAVATPNHRRRILLSTERAPVSGDVGGETVAKGKDTRADTYHLVT